MELDERGYAPEMWGAMARLGWLGLGRPNRVRRRGAWIRRAIHPAGRDGAAAAARSVLFHSRHGGRGHRGGGVGRAEARVPAANRAGPANRHPCADRTGRGLGRAGNPDSRPSLGDEWVINGTKLYVPNAHVSDYAIVAARTGDADADVSLFLVPSNPSRIDGFGGDCA